MVVQFVALAAIPLLAAPLIFAVAFISFLQALAEAIEELLQALFFMVAISIAMVIMVAICVIFVLYLNMNRARKQDFKRKIRSKRKKQNGSSGVNGGCDDSNKDLFIPDCRPLSSLEIMKPPSSFLPVSSLSQFPSTNLDHRDWMQPTHESSQPTQSPPLPPAINPSYTTAITLGDRGGQVENVMRTENFDGKEESFSISPHDEMQGQSPTTTEKFKQWIRWIIMIHVPFILCNLLDIMIHNDFRLNKQPRGNEDWNPNIPSYSEGPTDKESLFYTETEDHPSSSSSFKTIEDWLNSEWEWSEWDWSYLSYSYEAIDTFIRETYMEDYANVLLGVQAFVDVQP